MHNALNFYIGGQWVAPISLARAPVINPATEAPLAEIALANEADVSRAVMAARAAFDGFARTPLAERIALLERILAIFQRRQHEFGELIMQEVGAPRALAHQWQAGIGVRHLQALLQVLPTFRFSQPRGSTEVVSEPVGVVGLITPWNWPINQLVCKVAPALAAGCTLVLKPSEVAPLNALLFAEVMHEAGVPPGVFNLINGDGPSAGAALAAHPEVDMVSITGSTRAGIEVARLAAPTVKRVHQELGGKSANILLDDADLERAVVAGVQACFSNSGQSCNAPTRMLVPATAHERAVAIARRAALDQRVGPPEQAGTVLGPVINRRQFEHIQRMIESGLASGAQLVCGGLGRPAGLDRGFYVQPTVFAGVTPGMAVAEEEIFGPVLVIMPYQDEAQAVRIANASPFGLAGYVQSASLERAREVAAQLRVGSVYINHPNWDPMAPFGGYKQSGNGREYAEWGLEAFLETKAIVGYRG
ncbi:MULTISPECIES: aldehyde dehydrogenase family protein [unclassified Pseudomonas]|uniref:aldehyde dehydrogenase family protein n=1 Tax=unclassified Pseudomonas TaxID=196821 RepID=UPI000BC9131F|nr:MULTISPECIES: aldehyde dehydrogenase family protein [unclassified Pseudomonas]PVZ19692.1 aldehyde dehydrogenase (NAD+) [Pseudomonas sp. URIL14HWK12:I12]PVZ22723.1 aldehyde dehydrogenase (NAD+) [Pseudomonas sp. URIL14HWK12:I10]PVZ37647.1 aldehyde dehydrogenase (NAD+) [Pseudomonas sp. URIL14HWK12:I11]SNZ15370.1 aldehyde dehydrogenase (NAD+) [Pseudomonas sp. URIL14HWK12:I9]